MSFIDEVKILMKSRCDYEYWQSQETLFKQQLRECQPAAIDTLYEKYKRRLRANITLSGSLFVEHIYNDFESARYLISERFTDDGFIVTNTDAGFALIITD